MSCGAIGRKMVYNNEKVDGLFRRLLNTSGVHQAFLISRDQNLYTSEEKRMQNDAVELKLFMQASEFLDRLNENADMNFKLGHWKFTDRFFSLYSVNGNKLLIIHSAKLFWKEFDAMVLDVLLTF